MVEQILNVYKIIPQTRVEGPGQRYCIWVQGCKKHCIGCWAKDTWDFSAGIKIPIKDILKQINLTNNIEGVTILGGEPFEQADALSALCKKVKQNGLSVVCFSGYKFEELKNSNNKAILNLLDNTDILIDGAFEQENFDLSRPWIGSSNQRYIFLTDTYNENDIKNYINKIELRISKNGQIAINGMGDFKEIERKFALQLGKNIVK